MPISFRKKTKSGLKGEHEGNTRSAGNGKYSLDELAKGYFVTSARPSFTRKEIRRPLMKQTPDNEKETVIKISKMILRFMGDFADYRSKISNPSHHPNYGSVMTRLYKQLGLVNADQLKPEVSNGTSGGRRYRHLGQKAKGGTLRRLRATISHRFFSETENVPVLDMLPVEETLLSHLDQLHFIVGIGILKTNLRDELFCLVMKQITDNPHKDSLSRGWLLLWLISGSFTPTHQIYPYVLDFIDNGPAYYAKHLKKLLERTRTNGTRFQPPSYLELEAALQKKPIEISITLMDGTMHTVPIDAAYTSKEFCEKLARMIVLQNTTGFALYMCFNDKIASLGCGDDHVLDSISQCEQLHRDEDGEGTEPHAPWRIFFRKEIFIPWEDSQDDYVGTNLSFAQVVRGVTLGEYTCDTDTELALLAAQQYYIEYGGEISEEALQAVLPSYLPADKREDASSGDPLKYWRKMVMKIYNKLFGGKEDHLRPDTQRVKLDAVRFAKGKWTTELSRFYEATKVEGPALDSNIAVLGVNGEGVDLYNTYGEKFVRITYPEIYQISGEKEHDDAPAHVVIFFLANGSLLKFETVDAGEIIKSVTHLLEGLKQRSRWAVIKQDYKGRSAEELTAKEGDLIVLQQRARDGALAATHCQGTNKRTGHHGELASNLLFIFPTLTEPPAKTLTLFKNKAKQIEIPSDAFLGSIVSLSAGETEPTQRIYNWRSNAMAHTQKEIERIRRDKRETHVLVDGENPIKPVLNGRYSGSAVDSEDTSSQRAASSVLTAGSDSKTDTAHTSSTTSETDPIITTARTPSTRLSTEDCGEPDEMNGLTPLNDNGVNYRKPRKADMLASRDIITSL